MLTTVPHVAFLLVCYPRQKHWLPGNFEGLLKLRGTIEDNKLLLFLKEKPTRVLFSVLFKPFAEALKQGAELRVFL